MNTRRPLITVLASALTIAASIAVAVASDPIADPFSQTVQPILEDRCYACHGNGSKKGGVNFDGLETDAARLRDRDFWWAVLRNVRAGIMPPADKPRLSGDELRQLEDWIKYSPFGIDPTDPDPGRVTVRRLNRVEYRNTIRDLLGVDYDANSEFPSDDTGHGFDNNGDVLTLSPMLLEKYLNAANAIISRAVPSVPKVMAEQLIPGKSFKKDPGGQSGSGPASLSYYEPATASATAKVEHDGRYKAIFDLTANERYVDGQNDYNRCRLLLRADGEELLRREFVRSENRPLRFEFDRDWKAGPHTLTVEVQPLTPNEKRVRSLAITVQSVTLRGPADERFWVPPADHARFFPGGVPADPAARKRYAREILGKFAERAFRRPVDEATKDRLAALALAASSHGKSPFEAGVAQAMAAVLTSPRFLFREEDVQSDSTSRYPLVDEYSLASRLSYFLWSSMPDAELIKLAGEHNLRKNLRRPGRSDARRWALGGILPQLRRAMAPGPRHRDRHHQRVRRHYSRPGARPRGREAPRTVPRAQPQAARETERGREKRAAAGSHRVLRLVPPLPRVRAELQPAAGHAA